MSSSTANILDQNDEVEIRSSAVTKLYPEYSAEVATTGVVIKDVVPRSMYYHDRDHYTDDDDCLCTCACCRCECCPKVSDWCIRDPYGLSCGFTTWILFLYAQFVMIFVILIPSSHSTLFNWMNLILFHLLEFLAVSSHVRTMFSNPVKTLFCFCFRRKFFICLFFQGAVPLNNATPENLFKYANGTVVYRCAMCQSIKPPRAHHCRL